MNADQIRTIVAETVRQELAAFFASSAPAAPINHEAGSFMARRQEALDDLERRRSKKKQAH